jgi:hypothetical protein
MKIIVQTSDGTELETFDDNITDPPSLASDMDQRSARIIQALRQFLSDAERAAKV